MRDSGMVISGSRVPPNRIRLRRGHTKMPRRSLPNPPAASAPPARKQSERNLTQNYFPRAHLNCEPRQVDDYRTSVALLSRTGTLT